MVQGDFVFRRLYLLLIISFVLPVRAYEVPQPNTFTLISAEGTAFLIDKDVLFKLSPTLKNLTGFGLEEYNLAYEGQSNEFVLNHVPAPVLDFIVKAMNLISPFEATLCHNSRQELRFYPNSEVKKVLVPLLEQLSQAVVKRQSPNGVHKSSTQTSFASENEFIGELLRAAIFIDSYPISNFLAYIIAKKLKDSYQLMVGKEIHTKSGFGYQTEVATDLIKKHFDLLDRQFEELSVADLLYQQQNNLSKQDSLVTINTKGKVVLGLNDKKITDLYGLLCIESPEKIQQLYLYNNNISTIPRDIFSQFTHLEVMSLASNNIQLLSDASFNGLVHLKQLDLSGNKINALPAGLFDGLTQLQILNLDNNILDELSEHIFDGLMHLESINLSKNRLTELPPLLFKDVVQLQLLNIAGNQIASLSPTLFDANNQLDQLTLDRQLMSEDTLDWLEERGFAIPEDDSDTIGSESEGSDYGELDEDLLRD